MTKKEQAAMAALRQEIADALDRVALVRALGFSQLPEPQKMPVPKDGYVNGWIYNEYSSVVSDTWTESTRHGGGHRTDDPGIYSPRSASQNGKELYETKLDALIALRIAKEQDYAEALAHIDRQIVHHRSVQVQP